MMCPAGWGLVAFADKGLRRAVQIDRALIRLLDQGHELLREQTQRAERRGRKVGEEKATKGQRPEGFGGNFS